jgi:hypothetical protein
MVFIRGMWASLVKLPVLGTGDPSSNLGIPILDNIFLIIITNQGVYF